MKLQQLKKIEKELSEFVEEFGKELGRSERRYWCKQYITGLLLRISMNVKGGYDEDEWRHKKKTADVKFVH
ncbi:MAG: hypothetical protein AB1489_42180 [Acidobacteriota bacterium]